jgi:RNA polymerase sigma-70 factor (ECF subfamily)
MPGPASLQITNRSPKFGPELDDTLVTRAQRDPQAFAPLYDRYFDPVYRYCYHRLGDRTEAEDLTSLVFTRAFAALPDYREGSFRSWLFANAHNAVANHHRARRPARPLDEALEVVDPRAGGSPEAVAVAVEERRALHTAIAQLTTDQRRIIELRLAGLTGPEIAEVLGRSHAAVKMLQVRAVDRLQELLGTTGGEEGFDATW